MGAALYRAIDELLNNVPSRKATDFCDYLKYELYRHPSGILAYSVDYEWNKQISVHESLNRSGFELCADHEIVHLLLKHHSSCGPIIKDSRDELYNFRRSSIPHFEREANLGGVDLFIPTEDILDKIGYGNSDVLQFHAVDNEMQKLKKRVYELQDHIRFEQQGERRELLAEQIEEIYGRLSDLEEERTDLANTIADSDGMCSYEELASNYHVSVPTIEYKMQVLHERGYDVSSHSLVSFDRFLRDSRR